MPVSDLPQSVLDLAEYAPIEDFCLPVLREYLPDIKIYTLIPEDPDWSVPFVVIRQDHESGGGPLDQRFITERRLEVNCFAADPDGDAKGAVMSDAVRAAFYKAWQEQKHVPGLGWIKRVWMDGYPSRETDYATSAGPIQYADLPTGVWRYESRYLVKVRRERKQTNP